MGKRGDFVTGRDPGDENDAKKDALTEAAEATMNEAVARLGERPDHPIRLHGSSVPDFALSQAARYTDRFVTRFSEKFIAGQREHDTHLENDNSIAALLDHQEEELLDAWAYLQALRAKLGV